MCSSFISSQQWCPTVELHSERGVGQTICWGNHKCHYVFREAVFVCLPRNNRKRKMIGQRSGGGGGVRRVPRPHPFSLLSSLTLEPLLPGGRGRSGGAMWLLGYVNWVREFGGKSPISMNYLAARPPSITPKELPSPRWVPRGVCPVSLSVFISTTVAQLGHWALSLCCFWFMKTS